MNLSQFPGKLGLNVKMSLSLNLIQPYQIRAALAEP